MIQRLQAGPYRIDIDPLAIVESRELSRSSNMALFSRNGINPIERLWKWMKDVVVYNTYYDDFHDFRKAILGFFCILNDVSPLSELGLSFRSRIRDKFRVVSACQI